MEILSQVSKGNKDACDWIGAAGVLGWGFLTSQMFPASRDAENSCFQGLFNGGLSLSPVGVGAFLEPQWSTEISFLFFFFFFSGESGHLYLSFSLDSETPFPL